MQEFFFFFHKNKNESHENKIHKNKNEIYKNKIHKNKNEIHKNGTLGKKPGQTPGIECCSNWKFRT